MKHRVKIMVETEEKTFLGKKTVLKERVITVDERTYRKMQREKRNRPYSVEEMMLYDEIFDEWES